MNTKFILILILQILLLACENNKLGKYEIKNAAFLKIKKNINYINRLKLIKINDEFHVLNLGKSDLLYDINLNNGTYDSTQIKYTGKAQAVYYSNDFLGVLTKDTLFNFDIQGNLIEKFNFSIPHDEFVIHSMNTNALRYNKEYYYIQYGSSNNYNYVGSNILLFFNSDSNFKKFKYDSIYNKQYIHYNEVCVDHFNDTYYISPTLTNSIYKFDLKSNNYKTNIFSGNDLFLQFDTTKLNDVLYISKYTFNTAYNIKLICNEKNIVLVQRNPIKKENEENSYNVFVFDTNLNKIDKMNIDFPIDESLIEIFDNQLVFLNAKKNELYKFKLK